MTTMTISISDDRAFKLQELSAEFGVPIEDLVRISLEELLLHPKQTFQQTVDYVLEKAEYAVVVCSPAGRVYC